MNATFKSIGSGAEQTSVKPAGTRITASRLQRQQMAMTVKTSIKAGGFRVNRCETAQRQEKAMVVKTGVKAGYMGGFRVNRCETLQRKGTVMGVKTNIKAGGFRVNRCEIQQRRERAVDQNSV